VLFSGAISVKFPSMLVTAPSELLPFIVTLAPGTPSPFSSRTWPVIFVFFSCCGVSVGAFVIVICRSLMVYFNPTSFDRIFKIDSTFCLSIETDTFFCSIGNRSLEYKTTNSLFFSTYSSTSFTVLSAAWSVKTVC